MEITPVPRAPSFIEGIINLRGRIIPVVDLRNRLKIKPVGEAIDERIIVMRVNTRRLGLLVDQVEEVMRISHDSIDQAPGATSISTNYVEGVARTGKGMTIILDVFRIFSDEEHKQLMQMNK
jgi:purine-binding chemotaxis protein CheW